MNSMDSGRNTMNVTCLFGSPRTKSNSGAIADYVLDKLEQSGATISRFHLNEMSYRGCQGCMACKKGADHCVVRDDLTPALESVVNADALFFVSPVYFGDVSAQLKGFIDRIYSFYVPEFWLKEKPSRLNGGKQLVFIMTQGRGDDSCFWDVIPRYSRMLSRHGFDNNRALRLCGISPSDDVMARADLVKRADALVAGVLKQDAIANQIVSLINY
jgi:multimeric flavodoxin WrbA